MQPLAVMSLAVAILSGTFAFECCAGQEVVVGALVPAPQRISVDRIDHSPWNVLLHKYVDARGYVDYGRWKESAADQKLLDDYLGHLSTASLEGDAAPAGRLAFWINAYNAVTVKGILREYPTTTIRNHTAKLFGYNIWKDLRLLVADRSYSLDAMEHEVLRKMGEPRIHFAIVCASIGCPRLLNEAYAAERLDQQLTANAQAFFADATKFRADGRTATIQVSSILKWFAGDFGEDTATQLRTIAPYLPADAQPLARSGTSRVIYLDYDWGLNDQAKSPAAGKR
jgi:hypothetical protein